MPGPKAKPAFDLKAELLAPGAVQHHEGIDVDYFEIQEPDFKAKFVHLDTVKFRSLVLFENTKLSNGLLFENCEFSEAAVFKNIVVDQYDQLITPDSVSIVFKDCNFNGSVEFLGKNSKLNRSLVFENCVFSGGLLIDGLTIEMEGLTLDKCTIYEKLDVFRTVVTQTISLIGNTINTYARFGSIVGSMITFTKANVITGNLHMDNCKFPQGIIFNDGTFKEEIYFSLNATRESGLTIIDSTFEKAFTINYHSGTVRPGLGIDKYYISSAKFLNGFYVFGVQDLFAELPRITSINLDITAMLSGNILFDHLDVRTLLIGGYNINAKITLKSMQVGQVKIKELINEGGLIFSGFRPSVNEWYEEDNDSLVRNTAFYADDSNFGKAQFFQTNFRSFDNLSFHNVILTDISTSLVNWFTKDQLEDSHLKRQREFFITEMKTNNNLKISNARKTLLDMLNSKKEIYRQLKFAAQKQGDIPLSHEFQRWEMEYYKEITRYEKPRRWSEFLILYSSQSNNYGQSWIRAFWGLVVFSFLSYIPIGFLTSPQLDYTKFAGSVDDLFFNFRVVVYDNLKTWLTILNPTHRLADIAAKLDKYSSWVYFWDLISRIIVSYFIFQMVSAFRKFSK